MAEEMVVDAGVSGAGDGGSGGGNDNTQGGGAGGNTTPVSSDDIEIQDLDSTDDTEGSGSGSDDNKGTDDKSGEGKDGKTDGRTLPKDVQKAVKAIRDGGDVKTAKTLNDAYFRDQQLHKSFPKGLSEAVAYKEQVDAVGGLDGIQALQGKAGTMDAVDAAIAAGDAKVLDDIIKDAPDGIKKLAGPLLEKIESLDPKAYKNIVRPIVYQSLESSGLAGTLVDLADALKTDDKVGAGKIMASITNWLSGLKNSVDTANREKADPIRQELENGRREIQTEKEKIFLHAVNSSIVQHRDTLMSKEIGIYTKGQNFSPDRLSDLQGGVVNEITRLLASDKVYLQHLKTLKAQGDKAKLVSYANAKISTVTPQAVKSVWQRRYGNTTPVKKNNAGGNDKGNNGKQADKGNQGASTAGKPLLVNRPMKRDELDRSKDPQGYLYMKNMGYIKAGAYKGKFVSWK